ncbi:MAG: DUF29 domain-containing protein [Planctomycetaceae bacterium]|nr:DUF29 domain-containing protein [Planctomycetaceae bacterium]
MNLSELYLEDETAWLDRMVELLKRRELDALDYENLQEFLASMANRERRAMKRRLALLIEHLLKWEYPSVKRTNSWRRTILVQRRDLSGWLESGSLRRHAEESLPTCYRHGMAAAAATGLPVETFPPECTWSLDQALGGPGGPGPEAAPRP